MAVTEKQVKSYRIQGLILAAIIFVADQAVKYMVSIPLALESRITIEIIPFFNLTWAKNYGVSFGMLTAQTPTHRWLLVAMTGLIAAIVFVWIYREKLRGDIMALAMILGGALGNIVDRARVGYVIDYADLHFGDFRPFLIFNLADAMITIGVVLLLVRAVLIGDDKRKELTGDAEAS
jgi:signal peptidase II